MKNFIEITEQETGLKILCSIQKIQSIVCDGDGGVFIETGIDGNGESTGVLARESFDEIKRQIRKGENY